MKLFKHQQDLLNLNPKKYLMAWGTGSGKTRTAIELAEKNCTCVHVLVICPKSLVDNWKNEIGRWFPKSSNIWMVYSKEQFKKHYKNIPSAKCLLADEAHYFSNYKSGMTKALYDYIETHNTPNIYLLTATPYLSSPWNIYSLAKILGKTWNWYKFKTHFFYDIKIGGRRIPVVKKNIEKDIAQIVGQLGSTIKLEDCFDVPEQIFQQEYFELTGEQKKAIDSLNDILPVVRFTKIHQICGGTLKGNGYEPTQHFKCEKTDRLLELISEHKLIAVICRYNAEIDYLYEETKAKYKGRKLWRITGKTDNRHDVVDDIGGSDEGVIFINASCLEGYGLPTVPVMVFYSYDFSLKNYIQLVGRIQRAGNIKKNVYLSLIVKGTIDEEIYKKVVVEKQDFHSEIFNYEKK